MDRGTWQATVRGVANSRTQLADSRRTSRQTKTQATHLALPESSRYFLGAQMSDQKLNSAPEYHTNISIWKAIRHFKPSKSKTTQLISSLPQTCSPRVFPSSVYRQIVLVAPSHLLKLTPGGHLGQR